MTALAVALGAVLGAPARYLVDRSIQSRHDTVFPWGTLTVNVVASLILGLITGWAATGHPGVVALVGTGFCGALSTFSTFSYETMRMAQGGARMYAVANIALSVVAGLGAAVLGWAVGSALH